MPQITSNTQIDTINVLEEANSTSDGDLFLLQRGSVSYKIAKSNLIIPSTQISPISDMTVLGNVSGVSSGPASLPITNDLENSSNSHDELATSKGIKEYVDKITVNTSPFYSVKIHQNQSRTTPSEFDSGTILATYTMPSFGSIKEYGNFFSSIEMNRKHTNRNSIMYEMNVTALSSTNISLKLFGVDDNFYLYVDGVLEQSVPITGIAEASSPTYIPINVDFTLTAGDHTIQIIHNDSLGGRAYLDLIGDIISDTVLFRKV